MLWNRLLSSQESEYLTYEEFMELQSFSKLENLCHMYPNLEIILNQPLTWFQDLAKLLSNKYSNQSRVFTSTDGNVLYYVILHSKYIGGFMMLTIDTKLIKAVSKLGSISI